MQQYIDLLQDVLHNGVDTTDRTGVGTKSVFGRMLKLNLQDGFPIITTRRVSLRIAFEETIFFLRGMTDTKGLERKNINIWKGNSSREFLDKLGHSDWPEGEIGLGSYGSLWRHFPSGDGMGYIDQVKALLDGLKNNPTSRRHIISAWHPDWSISQSALPECHILQQYNIQGNNLNSIVYIRSQDLPYGCPYNMMGYGLLLHIYAKYLNLIPNELILMLGDTHIYNNQIPFVTKQVLRTPKQLPKLAIYKELNTFEDIISLEFWDMELIGYDPHPDFKNKPAMAV